MAGVEQVKLEVSKIPFIRMRAIGWKDKVVLAPDYKRRRLTISEPLLYLGVERQVGPIVIENVQLDIVAARPVKERLIVRPVVGRDPAGVGDPVVILKFRGF